MSEFLDTCEEQYLSIEQLLRLLICEGDSGLYINTCDSELNPDNLQQQKCYQFPIKGMLKQLVVLDSDGNPCIQFASTDNAGICNLRLDFEHACNSQYLILI